MYVHTTFPNVLLRCVTVQLGGVCSGWFSRLCPASRFPFLNGSVGVGWCWFTLVGTVVCNYTYIR